MHTSVTIGEEQTKNVKQHDWNQLQTTDIRPVCQDSDACSTERLTKDLWPFLKVELTNAAE